MRQNQSDIQYLLHESGVLNEFGIRVIGIVETSADLPDPATYEGEFGDAYAVGTGTPYVFYIYTRQVSGQTGPFWFNIGEFPAPSTVPGPQGPQGVQGEIGPRGSLWFTGVGAPSAGAQYNTGDVYLDTSVGAVYQLNGAGNWENKGSIRGPQGIQGNTGGIGPQGPQGPTGPTGPQGEPGAPFNIVGELTSATQLPTPTAEIRNQAYLIGADENYELYVISGSEEEGFVWVNVGKIEGVVGPAGPQGATGPAGPQGAAGVTKPIYYASQNFLNNPVQISSLTPQTPAIAVGDMVLDVDGNLGRAASNDPSGSVGVVLSCILLTNLKGPAGATPTGITITPATATQGTLTETQLSTLQANDLNYIILNNEIYTLQDKSHESGYLVYTHVGMNTVKNTFIKTITITISTRGWGLTTTQVGKKLYRHACRIDYSGNAYSFNISFEVINTSSNNLLSRNLNSFLYSNGYNSINNSYPIAATRSGGNAPNGIWADSVNPAAGLYVHLNDGTDIAFTIDTNSYQETIKEIL